MDTITPEQLARLSPFERNRIAIPTAEWQKYIGQWIVLSPDGSRILAGDADIAVLEARVIALGLSPEEIEYERVEDPSIVFLGGIELEFCYDADSLAGSKE